MHKLCCANVMMISSLMTTAHIYFGHHMLFLCVQWKRLFFKPPVRTFVSPFGQRLHTTVDTCLSFIASAMCIAINF